MLLDEVVLERLRRLGGEELVHELARIFLTDAPVRLETARDAFQRGDRDGLKRELHALKGSALNIGARVLQRRALTAEEAALGGSVSDLRVALEAVEHEIARVRLQLESLVSPGSKPLVAVIEDNADNRLLLRILLRDRYELAEYATGPLALEGMARRLPALAIVDIALPGMDGTEVLAAMQRHGQLRNVPSIALTAHAMPGDRERLLAAGFAEYVTKPILHETALTDAIERVLGGNT